MFENYDKTLDWGYSNAIPPAGLPDPGPDGAGRRAPIPPVLVVLAELRVVIVRVAYTKAMHTLRVPQTPRESRGLSVLALPVLTAGPELRRPAGSSRQ